MPSATASGRQHRSRTLVEFVIITQNSLERKWVMFCQVCFDRNENHLRKRGLFTDYSPRLKSVKLTVAILQETGPFHHDNGKTVSWYQQRDL